MSFTLHNLVYLTTLIASTVPGALSAALSSEGSSTISASNKPLPTDGPTYWINGTNDDPSAQNKIGTFLYKYDGCSSGQKTKINDAYYDAWLISNTARVKSDIDWNSAPALEFLGASGVNKPQQGQIQAVLANVATVIYSYKNPFQHALHVRCDDPQKECQNRPQNGPCQPDPPNKGDKPKETPAAYVLNSDPDDGYPMINFCDGFMNSRSLADAITYGKALRSPENFEIDQYINRAITFFHELTHLELAADSVNGSPNPQVDDLTISIRLGNTGSTYNAVAYWGLGTKLIARYQTETGYYVQRNADNFAFFALAKYIMTKNSNVYPHLPIVHYQLNGPPWKEVTTDASLLLSFEGEEKSVYLNVTNTDVSALNAEIPELGDYPGCKDYLDPSSNKLLSIDALLPPSAYPSEYNAQVASWIQDLSPSTTSTTTPPPVKTPPPPEVGDICGDWYKFFFDHFEIYGKNFNAAKFGTDGSGLKKQIQGCGDLTKWQFKPKQDDPNGYQWEATGNLPIGTKACVGRAVVSAGGKTADGCTGAG